MGKKTYKKTDVSKAKTEKLGISSLLVLDDESDGSSFSAVHKRYFRNEKCTCPACQSQKTRTSKVVTRKFKDILTGDDGFEIIDLIFHQRYLRCDGCKSSVFPEDIDFSEKGSRFTNRLSDLLAEGTFRYSYKKVCDFYGVPASTASVGAIMRRRIQYREANQPTLSTPSTLAIVEFPYYRELYPMILGIEGKEIYCLDILVDCSEATYIKFFRMFEANKVKHIYIEPNEELRSAIAACFPTVPPCLSQECVLRHGRNAFIEIIHSDGKRFPVVHKDDKLTQNKKFITGRDVSQIKQGMSNRPRLNKAYNQFQMLLDIFDGKWEYGDLSSWTASIPDELSEFIDLIDITEFYDVEIQNSLQPEESPPTQYTAVVKGICDAISEMPHCIFDVLRARCMLTIAHDTIASDDCEKRLGIPAARFIDNIKKITENIKEEREYEL
ncbi:transposase [Bariatricus massiliensis]|uniref:Transposase n=1 Tax=Bariatricus massiliensis TaxID=1745713 RepID=A0ABS8DFL4_9FIRM|nr:hypothetical protein [Bariatricus massiliensis]MCB7304096.1 transposase [Bariatricus massiliensis]MCB7374473.1 transposase [Bariatricus massiliensis]MCB7387206.1 transposase [Bariatricus massiliensis]MCB7411368.1 transposase [Bariatricus massiliensis]MCQ5252687.1 transposase [Bariatricus massiliensis]